jgi:hypothetical protein
VPKLYSYDGSGNEGRWPVQETLWKTFFSSGTGFYNWWLLTAPYCTNENSYRVFVKEDSNNSQFERTSNSVNQKTTEVTSSSIKSVSDLIIKRLVQHHHKYDLIHCWIIKESPNGLGIYSEARWCVDRAMDALSSSDEMPADVYFVINDDEYLINAVNLI